jgi:hypothetical protein
MPKWRRRRFARIRRKINRLINFELAEVLPIFIKHKLLRLIPKTKYGVIIHNLYDAISNKEAE